MKALILAGGRGKRLSPMTDTGNKCMLEFGGKPLLEYNLERAAEVADEIFTVLMGSEVEPRREFIEKHGKEVKRLDI